MNLSTLHESGRAFKMCVFVCMYVCVFLTLRLFEESIGAFH